MWLVMAGDNGSGTDSNSRQNSILKIQELWFGPISYTQYYVFGSGLNLGLWMVTSGTSARPSVAPNIAGIHSPYSDKHGNSSRSMILI